MYLKYMYLPVVVVVSKVSEGANSVILTGKQEIRNFRSASYNLDYRKYAVLH